MATAERQLAFVGNRDAAVARFVIVKIVFAERIGGVQPFLRLPRRPGLIFATLNAQNRLFIGSLRNTFSQSNPVAIGRAYVSGRSGRSWAAVCFQWAIQAYRRPGLATASSASSGARRVLRIAGGQSGWSSRADRFANRTTADGRSSDTRSASSARPAPRAEFRYTAERPSHARCPFRLPTADAGSRLPNPAGSECQACRTGWGKYRAGR